MIDIDAIREWNESGGTDPLEKARQVIRSLLAEVERLGSEQDALLAAAKAALVAWDSDSPYIFRLMNELRVAIAEEKP